MRARPEDFDNVAFRIRRKRCVVFTVVSPFRTAYWPDVHAIASELRLPEATASALGEPAVQARFLAALCDRGALSRSFHPARVGFKARPGDLRRREAFRQRYRMLTFHGACSREVTLGSLEAVTAHLRMGATVDVQLKEWDVLGDWSLAKERVSDVWHYIHQTRQCRGNVTVFTQLQQEVPSDVWEFLYDRPRVRVVWPALDLRACGDMDEFEAYREKSVPLRNLQSISNAGLWPHVVLPVSTENVRVLCDLVAALIDLTRGGSIEIVPASLMPGVSDTDPPPLGDYIEALLAIYGNPRIPLRLVAPHAWVAARVDSETPLIGSPAAAGAELAVLANGDLYASEWAVGIERWHLGNILQDGRAIRWERLDVLPEVFSNSLQPAQCAQCDSRYRCGGIDASVFFGGEGRRPPSVDGWSLLFELYCASRKALFEELLWGSVEAAAQGQVKGGRERIQMQPDGITFAPAATGDRGVRV